MPHERIRAAARGFLNMENKLKSKDELEYLQRRSLTIIQFIIDKNPDNLMIQKFKKIMEETYNKKNLAGLKTLSRDLNAWAKSLPEKDIRELQTLLLAKFEENLSGDKITHSIIKKALKTKKIENEESYRVIYEYLIDISNKDPFYNETQELNDLLQLYSNFK